MTVEEAYEETADSMRFCEAAFRRFVRLSGDGLDIDWDNIVRTTSVAQDEIYGALVKLGVLSRDKKGRYSLQSLIHAGPTVKATPLYFAEEVEAETYLRVVHGNSEFPVKVVKH